MSKYEGDPTDFTGNPRGRSTKPNDFFSYFLTKEEADGEWLIYGGPELWMACRPYIQSHISSLGSCILVTLKEGVNTRDLKYLCEDHNGSYGPNRQISAM